jgi:predicted enzyme related to lactoylglutathione lyase
MDILVNMDVPDADTAARFYEAALGLRRGRSLDGDVVELLGASSMIYLLQRPERDFARHWTPVHVDFVVPDVDAAAERALRAGAKRESETVEWKGSRCITFADPFGHGFCLIEFAAGGTYSP